MANLNETAVWEAGIYQWETSDPVQGGPNGIDNKPTRQLANRTLWLKTEIAKAVASIGKNKTDAENMFARKSTTVTAGAGLTGGGTLGGNVQFALGTPGTCSGNTTNWAGSDTHTHQLAAASPTVAGVAKLINNLTTDDADSALSAAMGKKLQDEKLPYITENYYNNSSGFNPGRNGFIRTNGERLNDQQLPPMEIHIAHPSSSNGAYSRDIGFSYGNTGWGLTTTAWDEQGNYRGQKEILTEENGLRNAGNQTLQNGYLEINRNGWEKLRFTNTDGSYWRLECAPVSHSENGARFNFVFFGSGSSEVGRVSFKSVTGNEVAAYQSWVLEQLNSAGDIVRTSGNQNINGAKTFGEILTAGRNNHWGFLRNPVESGGHWVFETNPKSNYADGSTLKVNIKYEQSSGQVRYIHFPELGSTNHTVAYQDWVTTQINAVTGAFDNKIRQAAPSGTVVYFSGRNAPAGWLKANGAAVSRTIYADLFAVIGTTYGAGDGRTTFNLPDIRGEFVRGWDDGRNIDRGRALGSNQSDNIAEHRHATGWRAGSRGNEFVLLRSAWSGQSNITADVVAKGGAQIPGHDEHYVHISGSAYANSNDTYATSSAYYDTNGETRSRNIAQLAIIKI